MKSGSTSAYRDIALLHISVLLFGFSAVLGQMMDLPAVAIAGGRVICSSLALLGVSLLTKSSLRLHTRKDVLLALFAGAVLALHWTTFFLATQTASVAIGTVTFSTFPLFVTFLEPLIFHERLQGKSLVTALVLLAGVWITVPAFSLENRITRGILWGLVSALAYGIMTLVNRHLSRQYPSRTVCLYEQGAAAILLLPATVGCQASWSGRNLAGILVLGLVCTALAHSLYVAAQRGVSAQTAGIISGMESVYSILLALLFLGEIPQPRAVAGGVVIVSAVMVSSWRKGAAGARQP